MIRFQELSKSFGQLMVLDKVSADIPEGKIVAVLGPNGSGKTTLIKSLMGMVKPDAGQMFIGDRQINRQSDYRKAIDYLPQISRHPQNLTARELVDMLEDIREQKGDSKMFIDLFGLESHLDKHLHNLSGGTMQKVSIMLSLMFKNEIMILDEPTNGLDPVAIIRLKEYLNQERNRGKTIIFTTHIIPLVEEIADEIIFLLEGHIYFQGSVSTLLTKESETNLEHAIANVLIKSANHE
ncbi:MAG: ABC transporter ATP-binding protein [Cyclobacteriaceae bacterium]